VTWVHAPASVDLGQHPHHLAPSVRVHRQEVDRVGQFVACGVAVAEQRSGDLVAALEVLDQDTAQQVAGLGR